MKNRGWRRIGPHPALAAWAAAALPVAQNVLAQSAEPWRCGGTWFVGVDGLPNDAEGAIAGQALPWDVLGLPPEPLHPAQLSTIRPGYPLPSATESEAAFRFRTNRDAAHLDGLIAEGQEKRRFIREPHAWILGLPLTLSGAGASPLVLWEGSHEVMRKELLRALEPHRPEDWGQIDITAAYGAARAKVFETCPRIALPARPGEATLMHRLTIHGVAPWQTGSFAPPEGRIIAYFRPELPSVADWLLRP